MFKPGDRVLYNGRHGTVLNDGGDGRYAVRMDGLAPAYLVPIECLVLDPESADVPFVVFA
jgi:hypothetical protein